MIDIIILEKETLENEDLVQTFRRVKERKVKEAHVLKDSLYVHTKLKGNDFQSLIDNFKRRDNKRKKDSNYGEKYIGIKQEIELLITS